MARMKIEFKGFAEVLYRLHKLEADAKPVVEKALKETHKIVTDKAIVGMEDPYLPAKGKYKRKSNNTIDSLRREAVIEWNGSKAEVKVGFDINKGGLPSIFLMYGTPRMKKDKKLYDAFYSKKTKKEIIAAQEKVFWDEIRRLDR